MEALLAARAELNGAGIRVALVSFNSASGAVQWNKEVGNVGPGAFLHLVEPSRTVYAQFGLRRSLLGVYNFRALAFYADELLAGHSLPQSIAFHEDVFQMGGDFLLGPDMRLMMAYYSQDSLDRPSVEQILLLAQGSNPQSVVQPAPSPARTDPPSA